MELNVGSAALDLSSCERFKKRSKCRGNADLVLIICQFEHSIMFSWSTVLADLSPDTLIGLPLPGLSVFLSRLRTGVVQDLADRWCDMAALLVFQWVLY
jgi:hypothetical protein